MAVITRGCSFGYRLTQEEMPVFIETTSRWTSKECVDCPALHVMCDIVEFKKLLELSKKKHGSACSASIKQLAYFLHYAHMENLFYHMELTLQSVPSYIVVATSNGAGGVSPLFPVGGSKKSCRQLRDRVSTAFPRNRFSSWPESSGGGPGTLTHTTPQQRISTAANTISMPLDICRYSIEYHRIVTFRFFFFYPRPL